MNEKQKKLYKRWSEISDELGKLYASKPSPIKRACGSMQLPECVAKHTAATRAYNAASGKLRRELAKIRAELEGG